MTDKPPAFDCDDPTTWRHEGVKIDLLRLLKLIEKNRTPVNLDLHGCSMLNIDARPQALQPHADAYVPRRGSAAKPPWLWARAERGVNLTEAHLEYADLEGAHLEQARLWNAQLESTDLGLAHLEHARLWRAHLRHADLRLAHLEHAQLWEADLHGAFWYGVYLERTGLRREHLGPAIGDELAAKGRARHSSTFHSAREAYMTLKTNFDSIGRYDDASWAYVKEQQMEKAMHFPTTPGHRWIRRRVRRGHRRWLKRKPARLGRFVRASILGRLQWAWLHLCLLVGFSPSDIKSRIRAKKGEYIDRPRWLRNWAYELLTGYGERPHMPVVWAAVVVLLFALIYAAAGNIASGDVGALEGQPTHSPITALVHSISAFATIGFNTLEPQGWGARLLTAIEAMLGIGLFALFVFTLGNRMRRS